MEGEPFSLRQEGRRQDRSREGLVCKWLGKKLREFLPNGLGFHSEIDKSFIERK